MNKLPARGHSTLCRLPWGLIGMIGLMVGAERFVARGGINFQDAYNWSSRSVARSASRDAKRYDVLCFGDSQIKLGVVPRAIRERSGLSAYNLANSGAPAMESYFVLRRALNSGAKPAAVVVDFHPALMGPGPRVHLERWPALLNPVEGARLGYWTRDPDLAVRVATGWLLPSVRCKDTVRSSLMQALTGGPNSQLYNNVLYLRNWTKNDGAHLFPPDPSQTNTNPDQIERFRKAHFSDWSCHPVNAQAVDRFFDLAASSGVPVYWVLPPLLPGLHDAVAKTDFDARHEAFIRARQARHANLIVVDGRRMMLDPRGFYDPIHLSAEGAYGFSLALGDVIRKTVPRGGALPLLPASRWITLAQCRPVPLPEGVENVLQSEVVINTREAARR